MLSDAMPYRYQGPSPPGVELHRPSAAYVSGTTAIGWPAWAMHACSRLNAVVYSCNVTTPSSVSASCCGDGSAIVARCTHDTQTAYRADPELDSVTDGFPASSAGVMLHGVRMTSSVEGRHGSPTSTRVPSTATRRSARSRHVHDTVIASAPRGRSSNVMVRSPCVTRKVGVPSTVA